MEVPAKPPEFGKICVYSWDFPAISNYTTQEVVEISSLLTHICLIVRFIISTLTVLTIILVWWYTGFKGSKKI